MKNNKIWMFLKPIVVLTVIAAVMAGLLGGTNLLTKDKIAELAEANETAAVEKVIKAEKYENGKIDYNGSEYPYFRALNGTETVGFAFSLSANGYGGAVKTVVGVDVNGKITAVEITDVSNETPGLGQNATRADFTNRFKEKSEALTVVKSGAKGNEIQAVTGATITSKAVTTTVNIALELFAEITKEGGK